VLRVEAIRNCSCVAFRLENVQDYYEIESAQAIINAFLETNSSVTAGIITNFFGTDITITSFLQDVAAQTHCYRVEIANNGYNFEDFSQLNGTDQVNRLQLAQTALNGRFGYLPKTFLPPFDAVNQELFTSVRTAGISVISSQEDLDPPPYETNYTDLWRFPALASFGETLPGNNASTPVSVDQVFNEVRQQFNTRGFAVVKLQPRTFGLGTEATSTGVNQTTISELKNLILRIKESGLRLVTLGELNEYFNASKVHPCDVRPISTTGSVTTSEVTSDHMTSGELTSAHMTSGSLTTSRSTTGALTTGLRATSGSVSTTGEVLEVATTDSFIRQESGAQQLSSALFFTLLLLLL
jgi:peptidoglycan/xylan/chitin deacetylase (PgdA/CDA1 family)